jgi:hypothetical protein
VDLHSGDELVLSPATRLAQRANLRTNDVFLHTLPAQPGRKYILILFHNSVRQVGLPPRTRLG